MTTSPVDRAESATERIGVDERRAIPVVEGGEPLVRVDLACPDVLVRPGILGDGPDVGPHLLARAGVCERLARMTASLPVGWRVEVFEAYRTMAYQRRLYAAAVAALVADRPGLSGRTLAAVADNYVALPTDDPASPPPHTTGAALDMLLVGADGARPDYGSTPGTYDAHHAERHPTNSPSVSGEQRANRLRLLRAAVAAGFANYPGEWWHYSYGDQDWCHQSGEPVAFYGRVDSAPTG